MSPAYEQLVHVLDEHEIGYLVREDYSIETHIRGDVAEYRICADADGEDEVLQLFGYSPLRVPEGCRGDIAEAITRANYVLLLGKFDLDFENGFLIFRISQILTDHRAGEGVISRMIATTCNMLDRYLPAFLSVIYANDLPKDAIAWVVAMDRPPAESEDETA